MSQEITITVRVGKYELVFHEDGRSWIYGEGGEGMEVSAVNLESMVDEYYRENF